MAYRLSPVTRASLHDARRVRGLRLLAVADGAAHRHERWAERLEDDWGAWGTLYHAEAERLLGFVQYGPSGQFPRAFELLAGPPSPDAVLVTCARTSSTFPRPGCSKFFLAAIGEVRDRGVKAIETLGYRYPRARRATSGFLSTAQSSGGLLADFGFVATCWGGRCLLGTARSGRAGAGRGQADGAGVAEGEGSVYAEAGAAAAVGGDQKIGCSSAQAAVTLSRSMNVEASSMTASHSSVLSAALASSIPSNHTSPIPAYGGSLPSGPTTQ